MANNIGYYLWIDGVRGDSKDRSHPAWIPIFNVQWQLTPVGHGGVSAKPKLQDIVFEGPADRSGAVLMAACATGGQFGSAKIDMVLPSGGSRTVLSFKEVTVASFKPFSRDGALVSSFSLTVGAYQLAGGFSDRSIKSL